MTDTQPQQAERRAELDVVDPEEPIVPFVHKLGGPVVVTAFAPNGDRVGYVADIDISADEVEVVVVPGTVARLVAVPRPPDDAEG